MRRFLWRAVRAGRGRWWRPVAIVTAAYSSFVIIANMAIAGGMLAARAAGRDLRSNDQTLPPIRNLRMVDARLWAGAQPTSKDYQELAFQGFTLVVDLRTGVPGDPGDNVAELQQLGLEHLSLPIKDGHASDIDSVRRFVEAVRTASGRVYMHCGGGVGRSMSLQAAYVASKGRSLSLLDQLSIGPPTIEQAWYVTRLRPGSVPRNNRWVAVLSRYVFDGPRYAVNWVVARI